MGNIDKSVKINIGGEERAVKYNISAIEELESMLPGGNVFELIQKQFWSVREIVAAAYCGIKVYDRKINKATVEKWVTDYANNNENGIHDLRLRLFAALGLSGLLGGEKSAFSDVLSLLDKKPTDEEINAGEN